MGKFPTWHRPLLAERQLVGEEKRLALRSLTAEQVRADIIRAAAHHDGASRAARLRGLADSIEISEAYPDNVLAGRLPIGDALLVALYGNGQFRSMPMAWTGPVDDWGPMLIDAIAAGLVDAETAAAAGTAAAAADPAPTISDSGAGGDLPTVAPAPVAVAALSPLAATAPEPAPAPQTTSPAPEQAAAGGVPVAGSEPGGAGGVEGSAPAAPPSFVSAVFPGPPAQPVEDPLDNALAALSRLAQQATLDAAAAKLVHSEAFERWSSAQAKAEAAKKAYDDLDALRPITPTPAEQVAA